MRVFRRMAPTDPDRRRVDRSEFRPRRRRAEVQSLCGSLRSGRKVLRRRVLASFGHVCRYTDFSAVEKLCYCECSRARRETFVPAAPSFQCDSK